LLLGFYLQRSKPHFHFTSVSSFFFPQGFLYNLFADPDIIRLPTAIQFLQKPLAWVIAKRRAPKSSAAYESIGGGSPIIKYTSLQAQMIEKELARRLQSRGQLKDASLSLETPFASSSSSSSLSGDSAATATATATDGAAFEKPKCYFAMRYWHPFTKDVLDEIHDDGINSLVILPLYPQFSISTSGSSLRAIQEIFFENPDKWSVPQLQHTVVPAWYHRRGYVRAMSRLIVHEILQFTAVQRQDPAGLNVLFSAHGVPKSYVESGDPYQDQIEECVKVILLSLSLPKPPSLSLPCSRDLCQRGYMKSDQPFLSQYVLHRAL